MLKKRQFKTHLTCKFRAVDLLEAEERMKKESTPGNEVEVATADRPSGTNGTVTADILIENLKEN